MRKKREQEMRLEILADSGGSENPRVWPLRKAMENFGRASQTLSYVINSLNPP